MSGPTFRLIGNLGSGKTIATANVIADLASESTACLSYFFCRIDDAKSLKARTVIRCLLNQLFTDFELDPLEKVSSVTDNDDLIDFCMSIFLKTHKQKLVICLDGLMNARIAKRSRQLLPFSTYGAYIRSKPEF